MYVLAAGLNDDQTMSLKQAGCQNRAILWATCVVGTDTLSSILHHHVSSKVRTDIEISCCTCSPFTINNSVLVHRKLLNILWHQQVWTCTRDWFRHLHATAYLWLCSYCHTLSSVPFSTMGFIHSPKNFVPNFYFPCWNQSLMVTDIVTDKTNLLILQYTACGMWYIHICIPENKRRNTEISIWFQTWFISYVIIKYISWTW